MGNPFFNPGNRNQNYQPNSPMGNMQNMFNQFQQFRNNFRGDPRQQVQDLLNSGRMSQEQFNYLSQLAQQFQSMFHK